MSVTKGNRVINLNAKHVRIIEELIADEFINRGSAMHTDEFISYGEILRKLRGRSSVTANTTTIPHENRGVTTTSQVEI